MHTLGKVLLGFVILGAIAGLILMTRQLQIKNSYTKSLKELKKKNADAAKEIETQEAELRRQNADYERVMHDQIAYWDKRLGNPNAPGRPQNTLLVGVGTREGVGITATNPQVPNKSPKRLTSLHVFFQPNPNNPATAYIGPFELQGDAQADTALLAPNWNRRPGEIQIDNPANWPRGRNVYRIRATVPTRYTTAFRDLYLKLDEVDRDIAAAGQKKVKEDALFTAIDKENTQYRVIIAGNDGTGGMLAELAKAQDERDAVLGVVDRLRRNLKREVDERTRLIKANNDLVTKLPQPTSASGKP